MKSIMKIGLLALTFLFTINVASAKALPIVNFENNKTLVVDLNDFSHTTKFTLAQYIPQLNF